MSHLSHQRPQSSCANKYGFHSPSDIDVERLRRPTAPRSQSSGSSYQEQEPMMAGAVTSSQPIARHPNDRIGEPLADAPPSHPSMQSNQRDLATMPAPQQPRQEHNVVTSPSVVQQTQEASPVAAGSTPQDEAVHRDSGVLAAPTVAGGVVSGNGNRQPAQQSAEEQREPFPEPTFSRSKANDIVEGGASGQNQTIIQPSEPAQTRPGDTIQPSIAPAEARTGQSMHPTGHLFPSVLRHDTDMSVRQLHVPGEWNAAGGSQ